MMLPELPTGSEYSSLPSTFKILMTVPGTTLLIKTCRFSEAGLGYTESHSFFPNSSMPVNRSCEGQLVMDGSTLHTRLSMAVSMGPAFRLRVLNNNAQFSCWFPARTISDEVPGNEPRCHQLLNAFTAIPRP